MPQSPQSPKRDYVGRSSSVVAQHDPSSPPHVMSPTGETTLLRMVGGVIQ